MYYRIKLARWLGIPVRTPEDDRVVEQLRDENRLLEGERANQSQTIAVLRAELGRLRDAQLEDRAENNALAAERDKAEAELKKAKTKLARLSGGAKASSARKKRGAAK